VHVSHILAKAGAATRTEAAAFARERDLADARHHGYCHESTGLSVYTVEQDFQLQSGCSCLPRPGR
jgi:hypothetical protein